MYLFKKLFHGNTKKKEKREREGDYKDRKSVKNPTYQVEKIDRSKLPSVEDLRNIAGELKGRGRNVADDTNQGGDDRENSDIDDRNVKTEDRGVRTEAYQDVRYEVDQIAGAEHRGKEARSKRIRVLECESDDGKHQKKKQVAVVCPIYQNVTLPKPGENKTDNSPRATIDQPESAYANTQELKDVTEPRVYTDDASPYQNLEVQHQNDSTVVIAEVRADDKNIYQNLPCSPKVPTKESESLHQTADQMEYELAIRPQSTDGYEVAISQPLSPDQGKKPKPQRPPQPSDAVLRKTEYFKVRSFFEPKKDTVRNTCPDVLQTSPKPGSPLLGKRRPGRLGSERIPNNIPLLPPMRKTASLNNIAESDDAEDYLNMTDNEKRKIFSPNKNAKHSSDHDNGSKSHVSGDDTSDGEDYLQMSNKGDCGDTSDKEDYVPMSEKSSDSEDYLPMTEKQNSQKTATSRDSDEDEIENEQEDDYIPMTLDE